MGSDVKTMKNQYAEYENDDVEITVTANELTIMSREIMGNAVEITIKWDEMTSETIVMTVKSWESPLNILKSM